MEDICNLYQQSLIPDTELVNDATKQLLSIYENPENISLIFQVINEVPDNSIKRTALAGLYRMMEVHWISFYNENQVGETIKEQLLLLFENFQKDELIANNVAACLLPVIKTLGWEWAELINFLSQTISVSTIKVVSYLLYHSIEFTENLSPEIINFCLSILDESINKNDIQLIICSSNVFALLSSFLHEEYSEVLIKFLNIYMSVFSENPNVELANSIGKSFNVNNTFIDVDSLLMRLIELSTQSDPQIYYITIRKLISKLGKNLRERFPFLLNSTIDIISSLFSEDCYLQESDSNYIAGVASKCAKRCNTDDFTSLITELYSTPRKTIQELYSILEITHNIIDFININSAPLYNSIMEMMSESLNVENHTIIEITIYCLIDIVASQPILFEANAEEVFKAVLQKLETKHQPIIEIALKLMSLILLNYKISQETLAPLLQTFIQEIENSTGSIRANVILIIYGFIYQLEENVGPFIPTILPSILSCVEDPNEEVQCRVLETLGRAILYAPEECESIIEDAMNFFIRSLENEDLTESAFQAIINVAKQTTIGVDPFIELAILHALKIVAPNETEEEEDEEITSTLLTNIQSATNFMNMALKYRPEACKRLNLAIITSCYVNIVEVNDVEILNEAMMAIVRASIGFQIPPQIISAFLTVAESKSKLAVRAAFKAATYLLKKSNDDVNDEFLFKILQLAIDAIKRELPCQLSDKNDAQILANYDKDLFDIVFKYLSCFAEKRTESFPSSDLLSLIISLHERVSEYETEMSLSPFEALKKTVNQPMEIDSQLFEFTLSLASDNCLTGWPFTILRQIICTYEIDSELISSQIEHVVELCMNKIDTLLSALTLLFVLASKNSFDFTDHISRMIEFIPQKIEFTTKKGEVEDMSIIFDCIFSIITDFPGIENQFNSILFTKGAFVINRYKDSFPEETTQKILQFIAAMLSNDDNLSSQLSENYPYVCKLLEN